MSLRYIFGGVGCGKTYTCIDEIIKKDSHNNSLIYIVPEQFSMESEKALLRRKKEGAIINTGVYSFRHLAFVLMSELNINDGSILNDMGRTMLLKKTLLEVGKDLELYKKSINHLGFSERLSTSIYELMQYNVTADTLFDTTEKLEEGNLKYKLRDIEKVYRRYNERLKDTYISAENTLDILADIIEKSELIKNSEIWIDGFKSFTPQEYSVISKLLIYSKGVNIALTLNSNEINFDFVDRNDTFFETKTTVKRLTKIAEENAIKIDVPLILTSDYRHNSKELVSLASEYLGYNKAVYNGECKSIEIKYASNKYEEMEYAASEILRLVREEGFRYDEIGVIIGSKDYEHPLSNTLNHFNIPNFIDTRKSIATHPLTQTILSLLKIPADNWSISSVFTLLKTGYIPIDKRDVFLLENYAIAQNIKGVKKWSSEEWEFGFDKNSYPKELINDVKNIFKDYISSFTDKIKKGRKYTVLEISKAVFEFLNEIEAKTTLNNSIKEATEKNDLNKSMADKQIWQLICDIFEKMTEFLGDEKVNIDEYIRILEAGIENATIGVIPALSDHLIVGDIERTRLPEIKALFILGLNEGIVPPRREDDGIFTDIERMELQNNYFELAPDLSGKLIQDRFNIYIALTKPTTYLYLSYPKSGLRGETLLKSSVIERVEEMFPLIKEGDCSKDIKATAPLPTLNRLISNLDNISDYYKDVYNYFYNSPRYKKYIENIKNIVNTKAKDYLSREITKALYGNEINMSVSRLEKFDSCPYSFFLEYSLGAYGRETYKFENLESGNIYHSALENIFEIIDTEGLNLKDLSDENIEHIVELATESAIVKNKKQSLVSVPRYGGYIQRMKRTLRATLKGFSTRASKNQFVPREFELSFGRGGGLKPIEYKLNNDVSLSLTGKIDRIDHLEDEDKIYVQIVDYKTSDHKIDFNLIYNGIDIQLPLYISTYVKNLSSNYKKPLEAGSILYYQIKNPELDDSKIKNNNIGDEILKKLKFRGIVLDEKIVLDSSKNAITSPVKFKKEDFEKLGDFIDSLIVEKGNEITKGNIKIKPYRYLNGSSSSNGCQYCSFKAICKIDLNNSPDKYYFFKNDKDILKKLLRK